MDKDCKEGKSWRMKKLGGLTRLKEEWKTVGVNSVRGWCNKVKDRGWLASKLGESKKKKKGKKTEKE